MVWTPERPVGELPEAIAQPFRDEASWLYRELKTEQYCVIRVDAPEQRHALHGIRVVESRNPSWYRDLYFAHAKWVRERKGKPPAAHGNFRRDNSLDALLRISEGRDRPTLFHDSTRRFWRKVSPGSKDLELAVVKVKTARNYYDYVYRGLINERLVDGWYAEEGDQFVPPNDQVRGHFGLRPWREPPVDPLYDNGSEEAPF